jgi:hypothetical protein
MDFKPCVCKSISKLPVRVPVERRSAGDAGRVPRQSKLQRDDAQGRRRRDVRRHDAGGKHQRRRKRPDMRMASIVEGRFAESSAST